jgi:hypothetical protein
MVWGPASLRYAPKSLPPRTLDIIGDNFSHATHRLRLGQAAQRLQSNMLLLPLGFALVRIHVTAGNEPPTSTKLWEA